jgi:hypothetical protein
MKYGNGYLPKIAYHMWMGYTDKVMYFVNRQTMKYGTMDMDDWATVTRLYNKMEAEYEEEVNTRF